MYPHPYLPLVPNMLLASEDIKQKQNHPHSLPLQKTKTNTCSAIVEITLLDGGRYNVS